MSGLKPAAIGCAVGWPDVKLAASGRDQSVQSVSRTERKTDRATPENRQLCGFIGIHIAIQGLAMALERTLGDLGYA